jgi:superfamily II DNA or RNA helicase
VTTYNHEQDEKGDYRWVTLEEATARSWIDNDNPIEEADVNMETKTLIRSEQLPQVKGMQEMVLDALIALMREREQAAITLADEMQEHLTRVEEANRVQIASLRERHERELANAQKNELHWRTGHDAAVNKLAARVKHDHDLKALMIAACGMLEAFTVKTPPKERKLAIDKLQRTISAVAQFLGNI